MTCVTRGRFAWRSFRCSSAERPRGFPAAPPCGIIVCLLTKGYQMNKKDLPRIRRYLGKSQSQMARLLGMSTKAIQSFEQGWRRIPPHVERQALFLLAMKANREGKGIPRCWEVKGCSAEAREGCPAWEFHCGHLCWFINGTVCRGGIEKDWEKKMRICRKCEVFRSALPTI